MYFWIYSKGENDDHDDKCLMNFVEKMWLLKLDKFHPK
jgi:hypothetical protein